MNIYDMLPKPFFVLAPMDDVTDTVFRRVVAACAPPDLYFTEFVNVDALQSKGRESALKRLQFTDQEKPLIAQIWGKTPENYYKTARQLVDGTLEDEANWYAARTRSLQMDTRQGTTEKRSEAYKRYGERVPEVVTQPSASSTGRVASSAGKQASTVQGFAGIDINMGCPDKTIVKNGCCAALINNRDLALEIIQATKEGAGGKLPVSVKTRLGFNDIDLSWHELLLQQDLAALSIHGRTRKQMSDVPADWGKIGEIRKLRDELSPATKIIGNGDVLSREQGQELAEKYGLDGIMIGRGVFQDPFVFAKASVWEGYSRAERLALYRKHIELFADTWQNGERRVPTLNKFCKVYINGFEGAKELREQLMAAKSTEELLATIDTA